MKEILITGCRGQLGNEIQLLASEYPHFHFFFTDREELDITNEEQVMAFVEANKITTIINCAAFTAVDKAESEEALCDLLNHKAPGYLAAAMAKVGGEMVQVSTDYVFDGNGHLPYVETDATNPQTVYGRTKLAGEKAVMETCGKAMVVRTAWLYSTFGNNFVKTMIRLGRERDNLGVIFDQIGSPTYARDLACAIMAAVDKGIVPGVYHFTNEGVCSWFDFTRAIHRIAGITQCHVKPLHTEEYPTPSKRPHYSVLDKTKIKLTFGIDIPWWEDSLEACISLLEKD